METPTSSKSSPPVEVVLLFTFEFELFWSSVYEGRDLLLPSPKKQLQHDPLKKMGTCIDLCVGRKISSLKLLLVELGM